MADKLRNKKTFWVKKVVFCFSFLLVQLAMADQSRNDVEKLLKKLNKPAVKSIKSPDGDIIDCVDILKQPAFDHPKLKNHKIRMRPSSYPEGITFEESNNVASKSAPIAQLWQQSGSCPEGTIPIRRITEEDILRQSSVQRFGRKNLQTNNLLPSYAKSQPVGIEFATVFVNNGDKYYGGKGTMNVWNPKVEQGVGWSASSVAVLNEPDDRSNTANIIEAGWRVDPSLYGDHQTRLFTFWTTDNNIETGCFDLRCSGFIQLNAGIAVGTTIKPLSVYNDTKSQYDITIMIWKDKSNGDWWIQYGANKVIGYWPSSLFTHLSDSATAIEWGGSILNTATNGKHTTTQMGSGKFPNENYGKASYIKNIKFVNSQNQMLPAHRQNIFPVADRPKCYDVQSGNNGGDTNWATFIYFGGPGRNPNCP